MVRPIYNQGIVIVKWFYREESGSSSNRKLARPSTSRTQRLTMLGRGQSGSGSTAKYGTPALPSNLKWIFPTVYLCSAVGSLSSTIPSRVLEERRPSARESPGNEIGR